MPAQPPTNDSPGLILGLIAACAALFAPIGAAIANYVSAAKIERARQTAAANSDKAERDRAVAVAALPAHEQFLEQRTQTLIEGLEKRVVGLTSDLEKANQRAANESEAASSRASALGSRIAKLESLIDQIIEEKRRAEASAERERIRAEAAEAREAHLLLVIENQRLQGHVMAFGLEETAKAVDAVVSLQEQEQERETKRHERP
jgi:hypothetical protein